MVPNQQSSPVFLLGRERESAACERLLREAGRQGGALLLRGPAGIGKTSLLEAARRRAELLGLRVLSTAGSEAESSFAFGALQPLLFPIVGEVHTELPEGLRTGLLSALGLADAGAGAAAPEAVGLAVLNLLSAVATEDRPLCLIIDDVHWLDDATATVLRFVARRLAAEPVVILAAGRDGGWLPPGALPEELIGPLLDADAEALVKMQAPTLPATGRRRVLEAATGNPLGIVELSSALSRDIGLDGGTGSAALPLTARLEASFAGRAVRLEPQARAVLLVAALAPTALVSEVLAAAAMLTDASSASSLSVPDDEIAQQLVAVSDRQIRFRHPLIRSSLVHIATASDIRGAHRALAEVMAHDRQRRLYHRVEASDGYDDALAVELETAADEAVRRGSPASAVVAMEQAVALTPPGPDRGSRRVRAAQLSFETGQADKARYLLALTDLGSLSRADRAAGRRLQIAIDEPDTDDPASVWELVGLAEEAIAAQDYDGALELLEFASAHSTWNASWSDVRRAVIAAAHRLPVADTDPRIIGILAQTTPIEAHRELGECLEKLDEAQLVDPEGQQLVGFAAVITGDYSRGARLLARAERRLRDQARLAPLARVLVYRGIAAFSNGQLMLADQVLDEAERLAEDTVPEAWIHRAQYVRAAVAGMCGDEERHRRIIDDLVRKFQRTHATHRDNHLTFMRGITATVLGHHDSALALLVRLFEPDDPAFEVRTCSDALFYLADSAVAKGRTDLVPQAIEVIVAAVPAPLPASFQSAVDYARLVTASHGESDALFATASAGPAGGRPFDRARLQFAYGRMLRVQLQPVRSREVLREALATFERLGNTPYAERARAELRAAGEAVIRPRTAALDQLSQQEQQVTRLVAEGLSNRQIGERLFLSPRTVGAHLYRIFPRLGVSSRTQLAALYLESGDISGARATGDDR